MDDINIFDEDKHRLHELQWRIMNFCWYVLHMEINNKRQIYPIGDDRTKRGVDFGGYVFRPSFTMLRKRIKQSMARKRHNPKSMASYTAQVNNCNGKNLSNKIIDNDNMSLADLITDKIERPFEGDKIKIEAVIDRPIEVLDFEIIASKQKAGTEYLKLQIRYEGELRFIGGGYQTLCEALKRVDKSRLPQPTIIRYKRGYYFDGTIKES